VHTKTIAVTVAKIKGAMKVSNDNRIREFKRLSML